MFKLRLGILLALLDVIHHASSPNSGERCYMQPWYFVSWGVVVESVIIQNWLPFSDILNSVHLSG